MSLANPTLEDIWKLFQETDRQMKETDRKFKETREESDRKWQQMREEMRQMSEETNEKIKEVSTEVGRFGSKFGFFLEEMLYPAAVRLFKERGIEIHEVQRNVSAHRNGEDIEIDLLVINDTVAVAIECKSTLGMDDVNEHLERLDKLKRVLPAHANKQVMGAVTGMIIPDNVARYAYKKGLFVIGQTGDQLVVRNDAKFKAKIW
jgi:hypothetical protein